MKGEWKGIFHFFIFLYRKLNWNEYRLLNRGWCLRNYRWWKIITVFTSLSSLVLPNHGQPNTTHLRLGGRACFRGWVRKNSEKLVELVRICSILCESVRNCPQLLEFVWSWSNFCKTARNCPKPLEFVRNRANLSEIARICPKNFAFVRNWANHSEFALNLLKVVRFCPISFGMSRNWWNSS